jgi:hypothetical protein
MSTQTAVDETSRFEQLVADLKIPRGDLTGVPQQLADAIAQAGFEASPGTIAFARKHSIADYPVEFNDQNSGLSPRWPHWAFELAKAALLSQQCSAAEALEAVTRSGGRGGPGGGLIGLRYSEPQARLSCSSGGATHGEGTTVRTPVAWFTKITRVGIFRVQPVGARAAAGTECGLLRPGSGVVCAPRPRRTLIGRRGRSG